MIQLDKTLNQTIQLSKKTAQFILTQRKQFDISKVQHKGLNDLVSYVDQEAEQMLVKGLKKILPQAGFITEEGTENKQADLYNWIIDPLDGTTNFIHGLPVFSISIALMKNNKIVLGVVHELNRDECFYAIEGHGAFCNQKPIYVSTSSQLNSSLLATGFPYHNFDKMSQYLSILKAFMQKTHGLRRMGSAAVDLAYVACGIFEGFFEYNLNVWDVAAGAFIVQQAGGHVTDFQGNNNFLFGKEIIAANAIHPEILKEIKNIWK